MMRRKSLLAVAASAALALTLAACGSSGGDGGSSASGGGEGDPIVLGATLPLSGPLGIFGPPVQAGYEQAVAAINAAGGVDVGGTKHQLKLVVQDNKSDPTVVTSSAKALINDSGAVALLGGATPPLTIPLSVVADQEQIPTISGLTPTLAWKGANAQGWKYAYDVFIDEVEQTAVNFQASDLTSTNKKVALFTDTEEDGKAMGALWEQQAPKYGYTIAYRANFPVGTTDFSQFVQKAKASGAEVVIAQVIPPDAVALWKQMKALGYSPKVAACEKCAHTVAWPKVLGELGQGSLMFGWWSPEARHPGTDRVLAVWQGKYGMTTDLETVATNYAVANILFDAIRRAGSADPKAINKAIGQTDGPTGVGAVKFSRNAALVPAFMRQWQGDKQVQVFPAGPASMKMLAPLPGFAK